MMRKNILLFTLALCVPLQCFAQDFELVSYGESTELLKDRLDNNKYDYTDGTSYVNYNKEIDGYQYNFAATFMEDKFYIGVITINSSNDYDSAYIRCYSVLSYLAENYGYPDFSVLDMPSNYQDLEFMDKAKWYFGILEFESANDTNNSRIKVVGDSDYISVTFTPLDPLFLIQD
jgi:hypothetical protein